MSLDGLSRLRPDGTCERCMGSSVASGPFGSVSFPLCRCDPDGPGMWARFRRWCWRHLTADGMREHRAEQWEQWEAGRSARWSEYRVAMMQAERAQAAREVAGVGHNPRPLIEAINMFTASMGDARRQAEALGVKMEEVGELNGVRIALPVVRQDEQTGRRIRREDLE